MIDAKFKWQIADNDSSDTINVLTKELGISKILATLLVQRGINNVEQAKKYFKPTMDEIHDPHQLHDTRNMPCEVAKSAKFHTCSPTTALTRSSFHPRRV